MNEKNFHLFFISYYRVWNYIEKISPISIQDLDGENPDLKATTLLKKVEQNLAQKQSNY